MTDSAENILHDLSYSFSSCESEDLRQLILKKDFSKAKKLLKEYLTEGEIKKVIEYLNQKNEERVSLLEIDIKSINFEEDSKDKYLIKYGETITSAYFMKLHGKDVFVIGSNFYSVDKIQQAWLKVKV